MISVAEIADRLNANAAALAQDLLPNGRRNGTMWVASGIDDTGQSESLAVNLKGARIGRWKDFGNACAGEEHGDMLDLVRIVHCGGDMKAAVGWAKQYLNIEDGFVPQCKVDPAERERRAAQARERAARREAEEAAEREKRAKSARALYLRGRAIEGTPAERYLIGRGLNSEGKWPGALRFHDEVYHGKERRKMPAMLAAIYNADGKHIGTHRTFIQRTPALNGGWGKAQIANAKMVLGTMWGGFVPINKGASNKSMAKMPEGEPLYVTEGIEDAICVRMMKPDARIVAAINLGNVGAIILPERARKIIFVADRDDNGEAQATLERSIAKQQARGLTVELVFPPTEINGVKVKDMNDWLDVLQGRHPDLKRADLDRPDLGPDLPKNNRRMA